MAWPVRSKCGVEPLNTVARRFNGYIDAFKGSCGQTTLETKSSNSDATQSTRSRLCEVTRRAVVASPTLPSLGLFAEFSFVPCLLAHPWYLATVDRRHAGHFPPHPHIWVGAGGPLPLQLPGRWMLVENNLMALVYGVSVDRCVHWQKVLIQDYQFLTGGIVNLAILLPFFSQFTMVDVLICALQYPVFPGVRPATWCAV